jgi:hypothetical protein
VSSHHAGPSNRSASAVAPLRRCEADGSWRYLHLGYLEWKKVYEELLPTGAMVRMRLRKQVVKTPVLPDQASRGCCPLRWAAATCSPPDPAPTAAGRNRARTGGPSGPVRTTTAYEANGTQRREGAGGGLIPAPNMAQGSGDRRGGKRKQEREFGCRAQCSAGRIGASRRCRGSGSRQLGG